MTDFNKKLVSFLQTLLGALITEILVAIVAHPEGINIIFTADFWQAGGAIALVMTAARSAIKKVWQKTAPVSFGGVKK